MQTEYAVPKELPSTTESIPLPHCGNLHLTLEYEEMGGRLMGVRAIIGRNACCGYVLLDTVAKMMTLYLRSPEPRFKVAERFKTLFMADTKGNRIVCSHGKEKSCVEEIAERVVRQLE